MKFQLIQDSLPTKIIYSDFANNNFKFDYRAHMAKKKGGRFGGHKRRGGGRGGGPGAKRGRR